MTTPIDRREFDQLDRRLDALDKNTQTLTGLVNSLAQAQGLFEYKHEQAQRVSQKLESLVDKINERGDAQFQRVEELVNDRESRLNQTIAQHKEILLLEIERRTTNVSGFETRLGKVEEDVKSLNKIIFMAMGGAAVISFLIEKLFSLIS